MQCSESTDSQDMSQDPRPKSKEEVWTSEIRTCLCKNVLWGAVSTMDEWTKVTLEFGYLHRIPTTLVDSSAQNHGQVHPKAPAMSAPRSERLDREYLNHLVCGNDDIDALEYIIPYPLFSPEIDIVGSRKHSCLKRR